MVKDQGPAIATWYNRKSFALGFSSSNIQELMSATLVERLSDEFIHLAPLYRFLMDMECNNHLPKN